MFAEKWKSGTKGGIKSVNLIEDEERVLRCFRTFTEKGSAVLLSARKMKACLYGLYMESRIRQHKNAQILRKLNARKNGLDEVIITIKVLRIFRLCERVPIY